MATMIINQKRLTLSIEDKARLLQVIDIHEDCHLGVTSGSKPNSAYVVRHDGKQATYCPCGARITCSHMIAATWYLEALSRAFYVEVNGIYEVSA